MIIKSRFVDYYDYVASMYGGGDPKVVYTRDRLAPLSRAWTNDPTETWLEVEAENVPIPDLNHFLRQQDFSLKYLIIAGKGYLLYRPSPPNMTNVQSLSGFMVTTPTDIQKKIRLKYEWGLREWVDKASKWWGNENDRLIDLCRLVGAPVFVVAGVQRGFRNGIVAVKPKVRIYGQCPILADLGMPAFVPATEMYQNLAYFMGNLMNVSPDKAPPVEVSNNQKILKSGFDLVKSFRHRI